MLISLDQLRDARHPTCTWTEPEMLSAINARFPGATEVDLAALLAAWLADTELSRATLTQVVLFGFALSARSGIPLRVIPPPRPAEEPRAALQRMLDALTAYESTTTQPTAP